jgi:hypothetical protein
MLLTASRKLIMVRGEVAFHVRRDGGGLANDWI